MNRKDFRIGNYVTLADEAKEALIKELNIKNKEKFKNLFFKIHFMNDSVVGLHIGNTKEYFGWNEVERVKITGEVLKQFGFKHDKKLNMFSLYIPEMDTEIICNDTRYSKSLLLRGENGFIPLNKVNTIDRLQNLYFAITGKELERMK